MEALRTEKPKRGSGALDIKRKGRPLLSGRLERPSQGFNLGGTRSSHKLQHGENHRASDLVTRNKDASSTRCNVTVGPATRSHDTGS